jgi:hypothetical protein
MYCERALGFGLRLRLRLGLGLDYLGGVPPQDPQTVAPLHVPDANRVVMRPGCQAIPPSVARARLRQG